MYILTREPADKLRNLERHIPILSGYRPAIVVGARLADALERFDSVITVPEFKSQLEDVLRGYDSADYARGEKGKAVPSVRWFLTEVVLHNVVPEPFARAVRREYGLEQQP